MMIGLRNVQCRLLEIQFGIYALSYLGDCKKLVTRRPTVTELVRRFAIDDDGTMA